MSNFNEERNNTYIIPGNFEDAGGVFGFSIRYRNAIEAVILGYLLFKIGGVIFATFPFEVRIVLFVAIVMPVVVFCIIGIKGDSLTQYISNVVLFHKKKRVLVYKLLNTDDTYTIPPEMQEPNKKKNILSKIKRRVGD